jgi:serine/threonine-protein kinase
VALHATGVVHRDLKPANLLLRDSGAVRPHLLVGDFGIATWRTVSMTGVGAAIGTPGYLAPEYLDGQQPGPATDLFAVGVLAAELLAGRRLVHHSNSSPDIPADWNHTLPLPDGVPAAFAAVLRRMAEPDPRRRYADCAQAREALSAAVPPPVRGDLSAVVLPDLLAGVPPGWTADGPEEQTTALPRADPAVESASVPDADEPTRAVVGPPTPPPTPAVVDPPTGAVLAKAAPRRPRRRARRVVVLAILLALAAGAGTLWWAATHRDVAGQAAPAGTPDRPEGVSRWTPVPIEPCSRAELGRDRAGGEERCQRAEGAGQNWVRAPATGFPKSDPAGPFPAEPCTAAGDKAYTPVGDQVVCTTGAWRVTS